MGLFNRFKVDVKPLTKEPVNSFTQHFEKIGKQLSNNKASKLVPSSSFSKEQFESLWGISISNELDNIFDVLQNLDTPVFENWETSLPDSNIVNQTGNIFKQVLLKAQVEFPTDHHINWFTGSISLDPITNVNNSHYGKNYSFQYPLFEIAGQGGNNPHIYMFQHNHPDTWGMNFEVMAKDSSSFLYIMMLIQAHKKKKISESDFATCFDKIKSSVKLPYYFFDSFRVNGRWLSYYDFNYRPASNRGNTLTLDYFNRSRWIIELLKGNHNNYLYSLQNSFYPKYLNPELDAERHRINLEHLPNHVPDALYYLLRCFFRSEDEQLEAYIDVCKSSNSRIIKDAALFVEELHQGLEFFGEIDNIQTLKRDFANGMKW